MIEEVATGPTVQLIKMLLFIAWNVPICVPITVASTRERKEK